MKTAIIVARSQNNVIGNGLNIPWKVKGEQLIFKRITQGGTLIMGRKTFQSIGRPLPGRTTIIVSRNQDYSQEGCTVCDSLEAAFELADQALKPVFVAGGGEIYQLALPLVDTVHISTIQADVSGDVLFPPFPPVDFTLAEEEFFESNINYVYQRYERSRLVTRP